MDQSWQRRVCKEKTLRCMMMLQEQTSQAVNSVVLLVDKESSQRPERCPGISVSLFLPFNQLRFHLFFAKLKHIFLQSTIAICKCFFHSMVRSANVRE